MKSGNEMKVGLFVLIGLILTGVSVIMFSGDRSIFKSSYKLYVEFEQVQGLATGSVISLTGIKVGNVNEMKFIPEHNKIRLELKIDRSYMERIRTGSMAEIRTQGALGDKYVYLIPGPLSAPIIEPNSEIKAMEGADLVAMVSNKGDSIERVFEIINEMHTLMKAINSENRSQKVMDNMVASSQSLRGTLAGIQELMGEVHGDGKDKGEIKQSLKHLSSILRKLDQGEGTLGALINDPTLHENLKALVGGSPRQRYLKGLARDAIQSTEEKGK
jgi:phospholipid/cholesterol/gamma-HCH transport system substrate-binding protein